MCRPKKNPQTQNLKLEFDDTFKTNNSFSQEANDRSAPSAGTNC